MKKKPLVIRTRTIGIKAGLSAHSLCLVFGLAGCAAEPSTNSRGQTVSTDTKLEELPIGHGNGILYGFADPPEPDRPSILEMLFTSDTKLQRTSTYSAFGGRTVVVTADPPGEADPPGGVDPPEPDFNMSIYTREGSLASTVTADPPGGVDPPEPDKVTINVRVAAGTTVNIYDEGGKLIGTTAAIGR